jgi:hypothetical protein
VVARNPTNWFFPRLFALFPQAVQQIGKKSIFAINCPSIVTLTVDNRTIALRLVPPFVYVACAAPYQATKAARAPRSEGSEWQLPNRATSG